MQRKHHKCKVLKVIGSEEKNKNYISFTFYHTASRKNFLLLQQKQSDDVCWNQQPAGEMISLEMCARPGTGSRYYLQSSKTSQECKTALT